MAKEETKACCDSKNWNMNNNASSGAFYGLGFVGALVYFMQNADSFKEVLFGIGKAILWPAFLIYKVLEVLKF